MNVQQQIKSKKVKKSQQIYSWLIQTYPKCFKKTKPQPLKHGIRNDILEDYPLDEEVFTVDNLRESLGWYRRRFQYLHAVIAKRPRIDLNGNSVADTTDEEVEEALGRLRDLLQRDYGRIYN